MTKTEIANALQLLSTTFSESSAQVAALAAQVRSIPDVAPDPTPEPTPTPDPTPDPDPVPPGDPFARPLLTPDKLVYQGSALLPHFVGGFSTSASPGPLTHRYVGGKLRFFSTVHWGPTFGNSGIYEFELPQDLHSDPVKLSTCPLVRWWGDQLYGGLKNLDPKPAIVHGLKFVVDEKTGESFLVWNYGPEYSDAATNVRECVGVTTFSPNTGAPVFWGVWRANQSLQFTRGGASPIPEWFKPFVGNRNYVLGFGGYYSVHEGGWGPVMLACDEPEWGVVVEQFKMRAKAPVGFKPLIYYPPKLRAWRDSDFFGVPGNEAVVGANSWTWCDHLGSDTGASSFVWIDLPDYRGALFIPSMGTGKCWYDGQLRWILSDGRRLEWRIVDERGLADAHDGKIETWMVPQKVMPFASPLPGAIGRQFGGLTLDAKTRTLYGLEYQAVGVPGEVERRHVVHAWGIK